MTGVGGTSPAGYLTRLMARRFLVVLGCLFAFGCKAELSKEQVVAAKADQTLRNLMTGMNARELDVLQSVIVITSTTGGAPRKLRDQELKQVVFPKPPFAYAGPGTPGTMQLRDGGGTKHLVSLIEVGEGLKVLARRRPLAPGAKIEVISFLKPVASE